MSQTFKEFLIEDKKPTRSFYVSGFQNKRGRYKITAIEEIKDGTFDISMGDNGVTYTQGGVPLTFTDNQAKPMTAGQVLAVMNEDNQTSEGDWIISKFEAGKLTYTQAKKELKDKDLGVFVQELNMADELKKDDGRTLH